MARSEQPCPQHAGSERTPRGLQGEAAAVRGQHHPSRGPLTWRRKALNPITGPRRLLSPPSEATRRPSAASERQRDVNGVGSWIRLALFPPLLQGNGSRLLLVQG